MSLENIINEIDKPTHQIFPNVPKKEGPKPKKKWKQKAIAVPKRDTIVSHLKDHKQAVDLITKVGEAYKKNFKRNITEVDLFVSTTFGVDGKPSNIGITAAYATLQSSLLEVEWIVNWFAANLK